jgi:hypothetical protein
MRQVRSKPLMDRLRPTLASASSSQLTLSLKGVKKSTLADWTLQ